MSRARWLRQVLVGIGFLTVGVSLADAQRMYWVDTQTGWIERAALDGSQRQALLQAAAPLAIALDVCRGRMFWSQQDGTIWRANIDGTQPAPLPLPPLIYEPMDLEIDPHARMLYVADHAGSICRIDLDTNQVELLYAFAAILPVGIALDPADNMLFFTTEFNTIFAGSMDGGAVYPLQISMPLYGVADIETDTTNNRIYWAENIASRVASANYFGLQIRTHFIANAIFPTGLALDLRRNARWGLYFTDTYSGDILRVTWTNAGPHFERVIEGLASPRGIALELSNAPTRLKPSLTNRS